MRIREIIRETASAGATSSASIATVANPNVAIGNRKARAAYGSGQSARPPKVVQLKNTDGTAKNALDTDANLFSGAVQKR